MSLFNFEKQNKLYNRGILLVLVLVLGAVFFTILTAFITYVNSQSKVVTQRYLLDRSAEISEAGLNYFKWYLHHNTDDIEAALPSGGATTSVYTDISGASIGEFTLNISTTTYCGAISAIDVSSTGYTYEDPSLTRTFSARFMRPTVANYSYILDAPFVWAGADRQIYGPYHSNGQIRMDGTNYSTVSSEMGTSSVNSDNGVYTTTSNASTSLFSFPVLEIPFAGFVNDLDEIEDAALNNGGYHRTASGYYGYQIEFIGSNQMRVTEVENTYNYRDGFSTYERNIVEDFGSSEVWTINADCPVVFIDDKVWLQQESSNTPLDSMISIVSSDTVVLNGNVTYADTDEDGLLVIAENDVLVGVDVPDDMTLNGIFVAQTGRFGRNYYTYSRLPYSWWGGYNYRNYYKRDSLEINGTVVSKGSVGTKWSSGSTYVSGFEFRENYYNRNLIDNPPPLVPNTSSNYSLIDWREED